MRRTRVLLAVAVLVAALLFGVARAPARVLSWVLPESRIDAAGYSGTLWRGRVASLAVATPAGPLQLGSVSWSLSPGSLLTLSPALRWHSQWGSQELQGRARWMGGGALALSDLEFGIEADVLRRFMPLTVSGRFSGLFPDIAVDEGRLTRLRGQIAWQEAAWLDGDSRFSLGSYAIEFQPGADDAILGRVVTLDGPLVADGEVALAADGVYTLTLALDSDQPLAPPLERALSLMAVPADSGFRLQLDGNLYSNTP